MVESDPVERARIKIERLKGRPLHDPEWRVTWEAFRAYARGEQGDLAYHRLYSPDAIKKARYVYTVAARAMKGKSLPEGKAWGHLRTALETVYSDLR